MWRSLVAIISSQFSIRMTAKRIRASCTGSRAQITQQDGRATSDHFCAAQHRSVARCKIRLIEAAARDGGGLQIRTRSAAAEVVSVRGAPPLSLVLLVSVHVRRRLLLFARDEPPRDFVCLFLTALSYCVKCVHMFSPLPHKCMLRPRRSVGAVRRDTGSRLRSRRRAACSRHAQPCRQSPQPTCALPARRPTDLQNQPEVARRTVSAQ